MKGAPQAADIIEYYYRGDITSERERDRLRDPLVRNSMI